MKYLITGSNGQLGSASVEMIGQNDHNEVVGITHKDLDISIRDDVYSLIAAIKPDVVVNTAAMTNVDLCEDEVDNAFAINSLGVRNIAHACDQIDAQLIHISTDFVFDGKSDRPYSEYDPVNPLSVYAKSKFGGDTEALSYSKASILRVAWVYGNPKGDFFSWAVLGAQDGSVKAIIDDQVSTPTFSRDIVPVIQRVASSKMYGLFNVANSGTASRLDMAREMLKKLKLNIELEGVSADSLNRKAPRPDYSALSTELLTKLTAIEMRPWQNTLADHPLVGSN